MIFGLFAYRRRRTRQANLAYIQQTERGSGYAYGSPYGGPTPFSPQYPPPAHNGLNSPYFYDPASGFAPVREISVLTSTVSPAESALDALAPSAFHAAAAVLSATARRASDQITEVKRRRVVLRIIKFLIGKWPYALFYPVVVLSWKPVRCLVTISLPQCYPFDAFYTWVTCYGQLNDVGIYRVQCSMTGP